MTAILALLLGLVNAITAILKIRCFECGKKLRLKLVRKGSAVSIECSCCWKHEAE